MTDRDDDHSITSGAYVLGALSPEEAAEFEAALSASPELQEEVAGLRAAALALAHAPSPVQPSAELRRSVLAAIDGMPQQPPAATPPPASAAVTPIAAVLKETAPRYAEHHVSRRRGRRARPLLALVAAAAAVLIFFGGTLVGGILNGVSDERTADQFAALNAAPDVARTVTELPNGGTAALVASRSLGMSAVVLNDASGELPEGKTFQLWYMEPDGPTSAGLVQPGDSSTYRMLEGDYSGEPVAMTIEPRGGSKTPTAPAMVLANGA
ncbi:anti-sigma factor [Naasia aerilata]|uniref:Regulator of SigK n=1 Tax=Naasia aerilata TaxID=1162966 RepID=A0ABN6XJ43_9MICO|nr:anti-sigma factor [Naasia aerilata]BDZ44876.1 hypothetical protein GCM10025866_07850 [Naasia aerilata]